MKQADKQERYKAAAQEIAAVIEGEQNFVARMATVSNILHHSFEHFFWTGFYCVDQKKDNELVIGPYQGTLGCLRIPFGRGVCGTAAATQETTIVDNVHNFPGHIACDANSLSEIVVPVRDASGKLLAVLDVDSDQEAMFDETDRVHLETIINESFAC